MEVWGYPHILSLLYKRFYADAISSIDRGELAGLYKEQSTPNSNVRENIKQYMQVFVFGGKLQKPLVENMRKIRGPKIFQIPTFSATNHKHVTDFQLDTLSLLGFKTTKKIPQVYLLDEDCHKALGFLKQNTDSFYNRPLIAVHPGSGGHKKNWPAEHYVSFITKLYQAIKGTVFLVEGPADANTIKYITPELIHIPFFLLSNLALPTLAAVLQQCDLFIGNDSGITHLAAALGIVTLAIFGPTDPRIWGPRGDCVSILSRGDADQTWQWPDPDEVVDRATAIMQLQNHQ